MPSKSLVLDSCDDSFYVDVMLQLTKPRIRMYALTTPHNDKESSQFTA